jgi:hypothetical protein
MGDAVCIDFVPHALGGAAYMLSSSSGQGNSGGFAMVDGEIAPTIIPAPMHVDASSHSSNYAGGMAYPMSVGSE